MNFPKIELFIYFSVWSLCFFYSMTKVKETGDLLKPGLLPNDFAPGYFGYDKDVSDTEWISWTILCRHLLPWTILHVVVCEFTRTKDTGIIPIVHFILTTIFLVSYFSVFLPLVVIAQFLLYFAAMASGRKSIVWSLGISLIFLINYNSDKFVSFFFVGRESIILVAIFIGWTHIRNIEFAISEIDSNERLAQKFMNSLAFAFYLPCFFFGPLIPYDTFKVNVYRTYKPWTIHRFNMLLKDFLRVAFLFFIYESFTHVLYCHAIHYEVDMLVPHGPWAIGGIGLCMAQFFYIKYLVFYGLPSIFAKAECYSPPPSPKCINRIHLYSEMWKHFDRGFYLFLFKFIYCPLVGKGKANFQCRLFASFLCFCFVFLWHGINLSIFLWAALNFVGVACEAIGRNIGKSQTYKSLENSIGLNNLRRLNAAACSPLWIMAVVSNFLFFGGFNLGLVYIRQITSLDWKLLSSYFVIGYCMCHLSAEFSHRMKKSDK